MAGRNNKRPWKRRSGLPELSAAVQRPRRWAIVNRHFYTASSNMDKYDEAVAYLTERPEEIHSAWNGPFKSRGGPLFQFASEDGKGYFRFGCLTSVKRWSCVAQTEELTGAIREDPRIPEFVSDITPDILGPVFAAWQRAMDQTIRAGKPFVADEHSPWRRHLREQGTA